MQLARRPPRGPNERDAIFFGRGRRAHSGGLGTRVTRATHFTPLEANNQWVQLSRFC